MSFIKIAVGIISFVTLALVLAISLLLLAPKTYMGLAQAYISANTDYQLEIDAMQVNLFPPRFVSANIKVTQQQGSANSVLLSVGSIIVRADARSYLQNDENWWDVKVSDLVFDTTYYKREGETADTDALNNATPDYEKWLLARFSQIEIDKFAITAPDDFLTMKGSKLLLVRDGSDRLTLHIHAEYQNKPVSIEGEITWPTSPVTHAQLKLFATLAENKLEIASKGRSKDLLLKDLDFKFESKDLAVFSNVLGSDLSRLVPMAISGNLNNTKLNAWRGAVNGKISGKLLNIQGEVKSIKPWIEFPNLSVSLGESSMQLQGSLNIEREQVNATVASNTLNANELFSLVPEQISKKEKSKDENARNLMWLKRWKLEIDVAVKRFIYQNMVLQDAMLDIGSDNEKTNINGSSARLAVFESQTQNIAWESVSPLQAHILLDHQNAPLANTWPLAISAQTDGIKSSMEAALLASGKVLPSGNLQLTIAHFDGFEGIDTSAYSSLLPFSIQAKAELQDKIVLVKTLVADINESQLTGNVEVNYSVSPLSITGDLFSTNIDLNNFATTSAENFEGAGEGIDEQSGDLIGRTPIDWRWLSKLTLDTKINLEQLSFNQATFYNFTTQLRLDESGLKVDPFNANLSQGKLEGYLHVKQSETGGEIDGSLVVSGLRPADLGQKNEGLVDGGESDLLLDFTTSGNSPQELASNLNGEIALEIQRATIRNNVFELVGSDIVMKTIELLNPFATRDTTTELECAAVYFNADQGVLTSNEQLVIETAKVKIRGGGTIDLNDETLKIDFVPTARGGIGLDLSSLASVVRIGGSLGKPQPVADPAGIFKAGASIGAAFATGGLSLVGKSLFDRMSSTGTACGKIFEEVPDTANTG